MRTQLIFNTRKLIKNVNSLNEFYDIRETKGRYRVTKVYKNKRGRPFSISLPTKIEILPEVVGLIVGEGFISDRHIVFANSNEKAIDVVLTFFKQFNLPIKYYLEISMKNQQKEFVGKSKKFWERYLKIKIKKVRLREEFKNITPHGTLHISICNSLVAKLLQQIIKFSKQQIEKNKYLSIGYLKGILAAEGNINIKKSTNCVYMIRISATKVQEREHYKRCLNKIGINIFCKDMPTISSKGGLKRGWKTNKGRAGAIIISRWDNFIKILQLDLLSLDESKKQKFIKFFTNNKFTKQFLDFKFFTNKKFTMKEAQNYFNFSGRRVNRLITLWKKEYLTRTLKHKAHIYKLNKNYFKALCHLNSES